MSPLTFVDLDTARAARGLRLVTAGALPSPWSEAAKGLARLGSIPTLVVRANARDAEIAAWTGARNVPVALHDDEPPRTGWAEILTLADRLRDPQAPALLPADPELRVRLVGLAHELAGEGGLGWSTRLIMIDGSIASRGAESFPLPVAEYLAPRYGYAPDRVPAARARLQAVLALFEAELARSHAAGRDYLLGDAPTALDVFLATFLTPMTRLADDDCPGIRPGARSAFDYLAAQVGALLPPSLLAHRERIFRRHLAWPIAL